MVQYAIHTFNISIMLFIYVAIFIQQKIKLTYCGMFVKIIITIMVSLCMKTALINVPMLTTAVGVI